MCESVCVCVCVRVCVCVCTAPGFISYARRWPCARPGDRAGVCARRAAAASVAECVTFPVDATKTRLQLQGEVPPSRRRLPPRVRATCRLRSKNADGRCWLTTPGALQVSPPAHRAATAAGGGAAAKQRGAVGMGAHILRTEGVRGLYRGLSPGVVRHCIYSSCRISLYENFRHRLSTGISFPLSVCQSIPPLICLHMQSCMHAPLQIPMAVHVCVSL